MEFAGYTVPSVLSAIPSTTNESHLMHQMGLAGKRLKAKYRSYQGHVGAIADNVIQRNFKTTEPLQKWTTDISQFSFPWGKCYLSSQCERAHFPFGSGLAIPTYVF